MKLPTLFFFIAISYNVTAQFNMCECTGTGDVYRVEQNGVSTFYFNASGVLKFLARYGLESPLIYDFNGSGAVDVTDLTSVLSGYGQHYDFDPCLLDVEYIASSGWPASYPDAYFAVVKPTVIDEQFDCPLKTWWVEIVYLDGSIRLWMH
jgi:hypothetical protein